MRTLFLAILLFFSEFMFSQVNCGMFCVQSIDFDTEGVLQANVLFEADADLFINYPYISAIINLQGDTIATGTNFYFGQISNSTQNYPLETSITPPFDPNFEGFILFNYDSVFCELYYPCSPSGIYTNYSIKEVWKVYPNPASDFIQIESQGASIKNIRVELFQPDGRLVFVTESTFLSEKIHLFIPLLKGLFYLRLSDVSTNELLFIQKIYLNH